MIRVVIADDHALVRQSVVKAVRQEEGFEVVGQAEDGPAAVATLLEARPDIALLDIAMPDKDGLQVASEVRDTLPDMRIVFCSMHDDDASLRRALDLDAAGFVSKSASIDELIEALRAVAEGGSYLSSTVAKRVMDLAAGRAGGGGARLTAREHEILQLLTAGNRPGEIADILFLSVKTVKNHLTSIYQKLGVKTGAQAVAEAYRRGLATTQ
ncbi:MAG: response regulator transcription factor [Nitriliruptorales bacterium]|nr:response regulator transcription factor [Nitriliruptorales bacterium]